MKKHYTICYAESVKDLNDSVNAKLNEGYEPVGGVVIIPGGSGGLTFYQAMYRGGK